MLCRHVVVPGIAGARVCTGPGVRAGGVLAARQVRSARARVDGSGAQTARVSEVALALESVDTVDARGVVHARGTCAVVYVEIATLTEPAKLAGTFEIVRCDLGVHRRLRTRAVVQARCARALIDVTARCAGLHPDVRVAFLADARVLARPLIYTLGVLVAPVRKRG